MSDGEPSGRRSAGGAVGVVGAVAVIVAVVIAVWLAVGSGAGAGDDAQGTAAPTSAAGSTPAPLAASSAQPSSSAAPDPTPPAEPTTPRPSAAQPTATQPAATQPTVSAAARAKCPTQFTACVDLSSRASWLQHDGHITYGPVRIMPGAPVNPTPTGHFVVQWKDKDHISGEYHTPMPYSVFFAAGGVAFHQGSLTQGSHGCVHLSEKDAAYYFAHLPVGVQVAVF